MGKPDRETIGTFISITGVSESDAIRKCEEISDLNDALSSHFDEDESCGGHLEHSGNLDASFTRTGPRAASVNVQDDIEEERIPAAVEASKQVAAMSNELYDGHLYLRDPPSRPGHSQVEDAEIVHAVSLSLQTAEREKASKEIKGIEASESENRESALLTRDFSSSNGRSSLSKVGSSFQEETEDVEEMPLLRHRRRRVTRARTNRIEDIEEVEVIPPSSPQQHDDLHRSQPTGSDLPPTEGRYTVFGSQPTMEIVAKDNMVTIVDHYARTKTEEFVEDPTVFPRRIMENWTPHCIELPEAFCGGWVDFSYDKVPEEKKLPFTKAPEDDQNIPNVHLGLYDDVIVFDHVEKRAFAIHWVRMDQFTSVEEAYEDGMKRLESLISRVHDIVPPKLAAVSIKLSTSLFGPLSQSTMSIGEYQNAVRQAKEHILAGDVLQARGSKTSLLPDSGSRLFGTPSKQEFGQPLDLFGEPIEGTTLIAIKLNGSLIVGTDTQGTFNNGRVDSVDHEKILIFHDGLYLAVAGDAITKDEIEYWYRQTYIKLPDTVKEIADYIETMLDIDSPRKNDMVLFGHGKNEDEKFKLITIQKRPGTPATVNLDCNYACFGTGSVFAKEIEAPHMLTVDAAMSFVQRSIGRAAVIDHYTGGLIIVRAIFEDLFRLRVSMPLGSYGYGMVIYDHLYYDGDFLVYSGQELGV